MPRELETIRTGNCPFDGERGELMFINHYDLLMDPFPRRGSGSECGQ